MGCEALMNKDLLAVFEYLEREKGIKREIIINAIQESLVIAARKSVHGAENVDVTIHPKTGQIDVFCDKEIVEKVTNPVREVSLKEYSEIDPDCELGQIVRVAVTPRDFGRIAAQKARQVITQKLKGAERDVIYEEFRHRINQLVTGIVKRIGKGNSVIVDLGKVEGHMPRRHYPETERYDVGDKVFALLLEVCDTDIGGAEVILSRSSPEFVRQLFLQEIPEISDGTITIEKIVREPGYRTKIVVRSEDPKVDPVGACIGMRGVRVKNIIRELHNEKVDVIPYLSDKFELLQRALNPIQIRKLKTNDDASELLVIVEDEDFGTAIGKKGQNVRLLGALIDAHLEIQKMSEYRRRDALERAQIASLEDPTLDMEISKIEGISGLAVDQLIAHEFNTPRKILESTLDALAQVPGIGLELADKILEQIRKQRA